MGFGRDLGSLPSTDIHWMEAMTNICEIMSQAASAATTSEQ